MRTNFPYIFLNVSFLFSLQRQIDVYHLLPNTTYAFRVWATNRLGRGEIVEVEGHTQYSDEQSGKLSLTFLPHLLPPIQRRKTVLKKYLNTNKFAELAKHMLEGLQTFDRRYWVGAVGIVMGSLMILGLGTCYLLYRECKASCKHSNWQTRLFNLHNHRAYASTLSLFWCPCLLWTVLYEKNQVASYVRKKTHFFQKSTTNLQFPFSLSPSTLFVNSD